MDMIALDSSKPFHERSNWCEDTELVNAAAACIAAQRKAAQAAREKFEPAPHAQDAVSPEALEKILAAGDDIHGISSDHSISNVISFNAHNLKNAVNSEEVVALRKTIDELVINRLRQTFENGNQLTVTSSGHFWYPPGAYMGWHTNNGAPGWRIYVTHSADPGQSFFRYRDPADGSIVTSHDQAWDVRLFKIDPNVPLWHSVYSQTDRFSFGYLVYTHRPMRALVGKVKSALGLK